MMCQVEMQRSDGDVSVLDGREVGSLAGMPDRLLAADPIVLPAARVEPLDDPLGIDPLPQPRDSDSLKLGDREVDVEDDLRIGRLPEHPAGQLARDIRAALEGE